MVIAAAEVIVPSQVASTQLSAGVAGGEAWLRASEDGAQVFIGPSGVTPATGLPLPRGRLIGPIMMGAAALHGVVGEGQEPVAVRVFTSTAV